MSFPSTPREFIAYAEKRFSDAGLFYGHGTDNALDEAVYLVLRVLGLPFEVDEQELDILLGQEQQRKLEKLISRRIDERIPVAYLINEAWFAGLPFYVDHHVLIPRSPLAELIEERFSPWVNESQTESILDIGTGSACIAVTCAFAFPSAKVDAVEIDEDAIAVAKRNIENYQLADRINLIKSDLFRGLPDRKYDLIVSNPPYVGTEEISCLPPEYSFEPVNALLAGDDGMAVIRNILLTAGRYLTRHGVLVIETGNSKDIVSKAFPDLPFTWLEFEYGGDGVFILTAEELGGSGNKTGTEGE